MSWVWFIRCRRGNRFNTELISPPGAGIAACSFIEVDGAGDGLVAVLMRSGFSAALVHTPVAKSLP